MTNLYFFYRFFYRHCLQPAFNNPGFIFKNNMSWFYIDNSGAVYVIANGDCNIIDYSDTTFSGKQYFVYPPCWFFYDFSV